MEEDVLVEVGFAMCMQDVGCIFIVVVQILDFVATKGYEVDIVQCTFKR